MERKNETTIKKFHTITHISCTDLGTNICREMAALVTDKLQISVKASGACSTNLYGSVNYVFLFTVKFGQYICTKVDYKNSVTYRQMTVITNYKEKSLMK